MSERRLSVHDLVMSCRITPEQGALLLEIRRQIEWHHTPWWVKAIDFCVHLLTGPSRPLR
jgi:hypothetical protein